MGEARQNQGQSKGLSLTECKLQYNSYVSSKTREIAESELADRYFHGSHWSETQLKELKDRGQHPYTSPDYSRKINALVGLLERQSRDPKAYPRTGKEDQGAELATAAMRYVLDQQSWRSISPRITLDAASTAISGVEISLEPGDSGVEGDYDISLACIRKGTFYADPRSMDLDYGDARFKGVAKWVDKDDAKSLFPEKDAEIDALVSGSGAELETVGRNRQMHWANSELKQIFIVEHWYLRGKKWLYKTFCAETVLDEGESYLRDEKGNDFCRFMAYRVAVDQDGDSYTFFRNMKSLIDEINQRRSKALHLLSMRRVIMEAGVAADGDMDALHKQSLKPDGRMVVNRGFRFEFEDAKNLADMQGQLAMQESARMELENYGPNPALLGQGVENKSGRAIKLLQEAGMSELGMFIIGRSNFSIDVYRAVWNAIRMYWKAERWIRVTDAQGEEQSIQINAQQVDPLTGMTQMVNNIGALDVDIIIDEGQDTINMQADTLEMLQSMMQAGIQVAPESLFEVMNIPGSTKKKMLGQMQKARESADQAGQAQIQAQMQMKQMETQQVLQAKQAESEMALAMKQREAEIALQAKEREAELTLLLKQRESELALANKRAELEMMAHFKERELADAADARAEQSEAEQESAEQESAEREYA